jgi:hypothetical protein
LVAAAGGRVRRTNLVLKDAGLPKAFWRHHAQLDLLGRLQRNRQIFVAAVAHRAFGEDSMPRDPVDGLSVGFLGVGLEDEPFAGPRGVGVHQRVEALGELVFLVMRLEVGAQVEFALHLP